MGRRGDGLPERTLVVRCPGWPLRALGIGEDEAAAVVAGRVVVAASRAARAAGVVAGLRRQEAEARCPGLAVHARDEPVELRAFEPVVAALERFGVPVTLRRPGWAAFPTLGPARRLGGEAGLLGAVEEVLAALGSPTLEGQDRPEQVPGRWWRLGVADGPFAASIAAARGLVVARGEGGAFLAPLAIEHLGNGDLAQVLRQLGIDTLGAFARLDPGAVAARFGTEGAALQHLAAGAEEGGLAGRIPPRARHLEQVLDPPTSRLEATLFAARGLAGKLAGALGRRGLVCSLLAVEVELTDGTCLRRQWSGREACAPSLVAERLRCQLEGWAAGREAAGSRSPAGVEEGQGEEGEEGPVQVAGVRLVALEVAPGAGDQLPLWGRRAATEERVTRAVARVEGALGPRSVLRCATGGGRGPGERARLLPFGEEAPTEPGTVATPPWPGRLPPPSPAVVAAAPPLAEVCDAAGAPLGVDARGGLSGVPARVALGGAPAVAVLAWSGPWPVDERWWEGTARRRRARLQVVLEGGDAYLLALERGTWRVEGRYD